jgi:hypothetical protein
MVRRVIISSETAYKVNNLRRDPRAAFALTSSFHGEVGSSQWQRGNHFSSDAMNSLVYCSSKFMASIKLASSTRMVRAPGIIRFAIESVAPLREDKVARSGSPPELCCKGRQFMDRRNGC